MQGVTCRVAITTNASYSNSPVPTGLQLGFSSLYKDQKAISTNSVAFSISNIYPPCQKVLSGPNRSLKPEARQSPRTVACVWESV